MHTTVMRKLQTHFRSKKFVRILKGTNELVYLTSSSSFSLNMSVFRLPVPESLKKLFCDSTEEVEDSPQLHGGRIRSFPHERGNWATSIFIPCKLKCSW